MTEFTLSYPVPDADDACVTLAIGQIMFLVGANGTGKSTLMHKFFTQHPSNANRITAHRQVWFYTNSISLTPTKRSQAANSIRNEDQNLKSRYTDNSAGQRHDVTIYDLINSENASARRIADAFRSEDLERAKTLAKIPPPITVLNEILRLSNLDVQISADESSTLFASRNGCREYSIAELSDGERNALLIIADVLTAPKGTLFLIDEPERHLHRSIVSPLLTTLLTHRDDCAFIASTHDVSLPIDQKKASVLLLRSYTHDPQQWSVDYVESMEALDDSTAATILGSCRIVLFIEGSPSSLDAQLYPILFPDVSVRPVRTCVEVERIVKGLRSSQSTHWVRAIGIIDRDARSNEDCDCLLSDGIAAIAQYSVESIYYHPNVIKRVLDRQRQTNGSAGTCDFSEVVRIIVSAISENQERLAKRLAERQIRDKLLAEAQKKPKYTMNDAITIEISTSEILQNETDSITDLLANKNIERLVALYPIRETPALSQVARALGFLSTEKYEHAVRQMLCDSDEARQEVREIIGPASELISLDRPEPVVK